MNRLQVACGICLIALLAGSGMAGLPTDSSAKPEATDLGFEACLGHWREMYEQSPDDPAVKFNYERVKKLYEGR